MFEGVGNVVYGGAIHKIGKFTVILLWILILLSTNWSLLPYVNSNKVWFEIVSYFCQTGF